MKLYINKLSFLLMLSVLLFGACETEESLTITAPEPQFALNTPGISSVFLNFALPENPAFTISWNDDITGSSSYNVEMSTEADFSSSVSLGTSDSNTFSMTVAEFNNAIVNTGVSSFKDIAIYIRVSSGSQVTNTILLLVTTYPVNAPEFTSIANGDSFALSLDNNDVEAVNVEWSDPILESSLGVDVQYVLEVGTAGTSFASPIEAGSVTNLNSISLTNAKLNGLAIQSGIAVDETGDLDLRVVATITDNVSGTVLERISETVTISVTTYLTVLDLSTVWGIVGSSTINQWGGPDLPFFETSVDGVLAAYVNLTVGEIKFRENNSWDAPNINYGDNGADGTIEEGGANIAITTAGDYKITLDFNSNTYTIEAFSLGVVGGAYNNWGATLDFMLEYDQYSDVFRGIVTLIDGEMKFRMNNSWDAPNVNYGDNGADGTLEEGGANIAVSAGIYIVTVDLNNLIYTLEQIDYVWGLVGGAYNNWGATPDAQFNRDWSRPFNDIWILNDVTLIEGEYKFRSNNNWDAPDKNYGDSNGDFVLEEGGGNIFTTAGTYSFVLDFSDPANPTYTKN